jgi:hypothetical protein
VISELTLELERIAERLEHRVETLLAELERLRDRNATA